MSKVFFFSFFFSVFLFGDFMVSLLMGFWQTGEIYYINWRNGMKAKEDPRTTAEYSGDFYSEDDSSYDSEESSSESSPSSREHYRVEKGHKDHVLVVAGCKSCLMYFMVPKQVEDCPKCGGQLLHFDRSENGSPWMRFLIWMRSRFSTKTPLLFEKFHCGLMKWETNGFGYLFSVVLPLIAVINFFS